MSDIFISYARSTEAQAKQIAEALRGLGYGVWRDDEIPANRAYADVIAERLEKARAVVVVWSAEAVKSQWVRSEAERARADNKLVQLNVDGARLPMPFDQTQCADLAGWSADADTPGWRQVVGAIGNLASPSRPRHEETRKAARKHSICVLPFANMSGDAEQEYFSDGISEDIITDLSKVSALEVSARNSAFTFKGKAIKVTDVARELNVDYVLEGSVRKAGNRVRITAQLIDGTTGNHLWVERALALDPDLAEAHAAKAGILRGEGRYDEAWQEAAIALRLDPESHEANYAAAGVCFNQGRIADAIPFWQQSEALAESDISSPAMLVTCYTALGDTEGARRAARTTVARAEAILAQDRSNGMAMGYGAGSLAVLGEADRCRDWMRRALLIDPDNQNMRYNFACDLGTHLGDTDGALGLLGPYLAQVTQSELAWAKVDPDMDAVRDDPRFQTMIAAAEARLAGESP